MLMRVPVPLRTVMLALDQGNAEVDLSAEIDSAEDEPLAFNDKFWKIALSLVSRQLFVKS